MYDLVQRTKRVAESILENESLTADLDDDAAQALLDWAIACAKEIVMSTAGLDDIRAEDAMYPRLRAVRQWMRAVSKWATERQTLDAAGHLAGLNKVIEQMGIIHGNKFSPPAACQQDLFMAFSFTHEGMGAAVLVRAKAGVDVKGIFETRGSETEYRELPPLYCANVPVRQDGNPNTFHHKVFVIDDQIVVTGSFNFSNNADESNDENVVIITNPDIAALYLQEFERRWAEANVPKPDAMKCK